MSAIEDFHRHLGTCPVVAILRGVTPAESEGIAAALVEAGIGIVEVPLNSPDPYDSIGRIAGAFGDRVLVGAGTVLEPAQVARVREAGGRLVVSPNTDPAVIAAAAAAGMVSSPGYFTPTEAFAAIAAGAHALKLFPAEAASPAVLKAHKAVLPAAVPVLAVGGITPESIAAWRDCGADGFGLGSALYRPGQDAGATLGKAREFVAAVRR